MAENKVRKIKAKAQKTKSKPKTKEIKLAVPKVAKAKTKVPARKSKKANPLLSSRLSDLPVSLPAVPSSPPLEKPKKRLRKPKIKAATETREIPLKQESVFDLKSEMPMVKELKISTPPKSEHRADPEHYELPAGYGDNKIVLMVRDPYWLYSYWEVSASECEKVKTGLGDETFSNSKLVLRIYDITGVKFTGVNAHVFFDIEVSSYIGNWYIQVGRPNRSFIVDIGYRTQDGHFFLLARSNAVVTPSDSCSEVVDEEWMVPDWEKIYALSGGFGMGRSSEEIKEMMSLRLEERIGSEWISSMSSPTRIPKERPFWLEVATELIVYGATEPTAKVTIQGKPVKIRKDGTFSFRFNLPEGFYDLPVEATRDDGAEKRRINPTVERRTR